MACPLLTLTPKSLGSPFQHKEAGMSIGRREFLKSSAALAALSAAGGFSCIEIAAAGPIEVPTVDGLAIRVLVDSSYDLFFRPAEANGVKIAPPARIADFRRSLHNEWGLSLWLESERGGEKRTVMLDYGYTPTVLFNNMELTGVDPSKIDALIVSHGHYDHFGGLQAFLDKYRNDCRPTSSSMPAAKTPFVIGSRATRSKVLLTSAGSIAESSHQKR